jgi:hypothetical protein
MLAFTMVNMTTPTAVYRGWFPSIVRLPSGHTLRPVRVYATDAGLFVYSQANLPEPIFHSPILLDKTPEPGTDYASRKRGWTIATEAGPISINQASCACGLSTLKTFRPPWAGIEKAWGE